MANHPWRISERTWPEVRDVPYSVAVLPWGATEAHNTHLPYATDTILAQAVADAAAEHAWNAGARVAVLPVVAYGVQAGQLDIPFCINMSPSTQLALLRDVVNSLIPHSVKSLVIMNAHGGNDFKPIIRELQPAVPLFLCTVNWWAAGDASTTFAVPGDHAGELETSAMQHVAPSLVHPLQTAGEGRARDWKFQAMREGWAWAPRQWTRVTNDTGVGDPRASTAEKGAQYMAQSAERIGAFLSQLASTNADAYYQS